MSTVLPRKKRDRIAYAKKLNRRTPNPQETYRSVIKETVLRRLYDDQFNYWNKELQNLSAENAESQGRRGRGYSIFWKNREYAPQTVNWTSNGEKGYCLPLNPRVPEYTARMLEIAEEFDELAEERYEAERFLSNLVLFAAPPKRLQKILGRTLYRVVQKEIEHWCAGFSDADWNVNNEFSLKTFVETNQEIIKKMNERVMLNLVTL